MSQSAARSSIYRLIHLGLAATAGSARSGGNTYEITEAGRARLP